MAPDLRHGTGADPAAGPAGRGAERPCATPPPASQAAPERWDGAAVHPLPSGLEGVALHLVPIPADGAALDAARADLSAGEQARAGRFLNAEERARFTIARAALRRLLGEALEMAPGRVRLASTPAGKPILPDCPELHFSVSHAGGFALIGLTRAGALGVDLERERTDFDEMGIARARFAPDEVAALATLPLAERRRTFYALWTTKEALAKASGVGIGAHNPHVAPALWPALMAADAAPGPALAVGASRVVRLPAPTGYAAALALGAPKGVGDR